jgi:autotransporter-associated beta strand protein
VNFTSAAPAIASLSGSGAGTSNIVLGTLTSSGSATTLTVGGNNASTFFGGVISDKTAINANAKGSLTKTGTGALTLANTSTYTGATNVSAGTLIVNGAVSGSSLVTVGDSAVLSGTGTVGALSVTASNPGTSAGGAVDPGSGVASVAANGAVTGNAITGVLTTGTFSLGAGAHLSMQLGGTTAGTGHDQVVASAVTLAGDAQVHLINGYTPVAGNTFFLVLNGGVDAVNGAFSTINNQTATEGAPINIDGSQFTLTYLANGDTGALGNDVALQVVPEPASFVSLFAGIGVLALWHRSKRKQS